MKRKFIRYLKDDFVMDFVCYSLVFLATIIFIYPVIYTFSLSISANEYVEAQKIWLLPKGFSLNAYKFALKHDYLLGSIYNSIKYTALRTVYSLLLTIFGAYALSHKELRGNGVISFFIFFTMIFGGGLIPTYLLVKDLKLIDTIWAIIIPLAVSPYNLIVMRSSFQQNPPSLEESAKIDGAGYFRILFQIIAPISKPVIATIGLFYMVGAWNEFFRPMIYLNTKEKFPLQLIARSLIITAGDSTVNRQQNAERGQEGDSVFTAMSFRAAVMFITILPMLVAYPYVQKHFVKGVVIGAVKG